VGAGSTSGVGGKSGKEWRQEKAGDKRRECGWRKGGDGEE